MRPESLGYRSGHASLLSLLLLLFVLGGCATRTPRAPEHTDEHDRRFLNDALQHLDGDLRIARTCEGKQIRTELATFCAELYDDQLWEYAHMADWLDEWYQEDPPSDNLPLWLRTQDGEAFERYFLKGVLEGHRELAKEAATCTRAAKHGELAEFCREIVRHRTAEASKMEKWNCEWFKQCD